MGKKRSYKIPFVVIEENGDTLYLIILNRDNEAIWATTASECEISVIIRFLRSGGGVHSAGFSWKTTLEDYDPEDIWEQAMHDMMKGESEDSLKILADEDGFKGDRGKYPVLYSVFSSQEVFK